MTLAELHPGQHAIIKEFEAYMPPIKLLEMGCLPGNTVELLQVAPLKDPLYFNINGSHLAIRRSIADRITIQLITDPAANE